MFYGLPKKNGDFPWFFSMFSSDLGSGSAGLPLGPLGVEPPGTLAVDGSH